MLEFFGVVERPPPPTQPLLFRGAAGFHPKVPLTVYVPRKDPCLEGIVIFCGASFAFIIRVFIYIYIYGNKRGVIRRRFKGYIYRITEILATEGVYQVRLIDYHGSPLKKNGV